ncbi:uba2 [Symbiodinium natans]|uniref:Uba2 protein n=1 Tax=Symbiodinium natans TaxID=878477 RepID=A0A812UPF7_9DINO|nr:uba2 [Symbiodinium natans]
MRNLAPQLIYLWLCFSIANHAEKQRPDAKIVSHHGNVKDSEFGLEFVSKFDIVVNALDNLEARRHALRLTGGEPAVSRRRQAAPRSGKYWPLGTGEELGVGKDGTKKRALTEHLRERLPGVRDLTVTPLPNRGLQQILNVLKQGPHYEVLGISYFGNDLSRGLTRHLEESLEELVEVAGHKADCVVFFVGGYAKKYTGLNLDARYDQGLSKIRKRLRRAGYLVTDGRSEVEMWPLARDGIHWDASAREEVCDFWAYLLTSARRNQCNWTDSAIRLATAAEAAGTAAAMWRSLAHEAIGATAPANGAAVATWLTSAMCEEGLQKRNH